VPERRGEPTANHLNERGTLSRIKNRIETGLWGGGKKKNLKEKEMEGSQLLVRERKKVENINLVNRGE